MSKPLDDVLAFRDDLRDYATSKPLAQEPTSQLVMLPKPAEMEHGYPLRCLIGIAEPAKPCSIILQNVHFPTHEARSCAPHAKYTLSVTFNRLLTAPALRLQCEWPHVKHPLNPDQSFKLVLEFHLASRDNGSFGAENLQMQEDVEYFGKHGDEMSFVGHGATTEGFNNLSSVWNQLQEHGREIVTILKALIKPPSPVPIRLRFSTPIAESTSSFATLLPYVLGQGVDELPSLSRPEWNAFLPLNPKRAIEELVYNVTPFPMLALEPCYTFSTVTQASVELFESARFAHLEEEIKLLEWAKVHHQGVLIKFGGAVVMASRFTELSRLGGGQKFSLPDQMSCAITWTDPSTGENLTERANRSSLCVHLPISVDAIFVFTNPSSRLRDACIRPCDADARFFSPSVKFTPSLPRFPIESQLRTAVHLQHPDSARWQQLVLNQDHTQEKIDLATHRCEGVPQPSDTEVEDAFQWLLNWQDWNEAQLQVLYQLREALGGIVLCTAPAGCGKTLVQIATCVFAYKLDLHVLVLAPANSNCADFMRKLSSYFKDDPDIRGTRVFPSSADNDLWDERKHSNRTTTPDENTDLLELEMVRSDIQANGEKYSVFAEYGLHASILKAARDAEFSHVADLNGKNVDIWKELRTYLQAASDGTFAWRDSKAVDKYRAAYDACKAYYVAMSRMIVTTTGNVQTATIVDNWAQNKYGIECKGILVVADENCKDNEINSLSALLWPGFRKKVTGMVLLGDERQLEPFSNANGPVCTNPFNHRLAMPLLTRLKHEGFPCTELVEQHRMHYSIADWPFKNFYPPGMQNGPGTHKPLRKKQPGLFNCLQTILAGLGTVVDAREGDVKTDEMLRTQYLQVFGRRDNSKRSAVVREHIVAFFNHVYWPLLAYYGEKLSENVIVIVAYKESRNCWSDAVSYLQRTYQIPSKQLPRIMTIDSSQGSEAPITIIDCSVQMFSPQRSRRDIGFVDNDKRMNVALTRAQEVRMILGGSCSVNERPRRQAGLPSYVRYREESKAVIKVPTQLIDPRHEHWLRYLRKKENVKLAIRYADDVGRKE